MSSTIKNVLCKICLILIIGFSLFTASYAHAQPQTAIIHVDGDSGLAVPNPPNPGDSWSNAYKFLQDALDQAEDLILNDPNIDKAHLWVAATDTSNPYRPERSAANPFGTGNKTATFRLDFNNIKLLGGFLGGINGETDPLDRDPFKNITVLTGIIRPSCGHPTAGSCFKANGSIACDNAVCCEAVCAIDPTCCNVEWDQACADLAPNVCGPCGEGKGERLL